MKAESERIIKFIKDYVKQSGRKGIVLGLSGGIDSAVVAVLAKRALGNKVHCIYLPDEYKKQDFDRQHIEKLCKRFDLTFQEDYIRDTVEHFFYPMDTPTTKAKIILGNIKARVRMTYLYKEANTRDCLVIGTSNKSEIMIGYFTKHGDGGSDIEPIGHLYKTQVYELAKHLDIPNEIVDKPPTAGLWDGQTDEGELGISYKKLDKILHYKSSFTTHTIQQIADIVDCDEDDVELVKNLVERSEHKRRVPKCLK